MTLTLQEDVSRLLGHECVYTHYNYTVQRQRHQVTSYSWIKMGDYYWMGNHSNRDFELAARMYASAARRGEPEVSLLINVHYLTMYTLLL